MSMNPVQVTVSPTYKRDVRTVATATPPGKPDGQPSIVTEGGYVKDPPKLPHPPPVPGGLSTPEGTSGAGELYPMPLPPEPEPPPVGSAVYPFVSRLMPGANTTPGHPLCGDYKAGRNSPAPLEPAATAILPVGVSRDDVGLDLNVNSAANGGELRDVDLRGGWTISFSPGVVDFTIRECVFSNDLKATPYYAVIDAYNNAPVGLAVIDNDFIGLKVAPFETSIASWVSVGAEPVTFHRNVSLHPPGDHFKTEGGLITENFCYGGGTTVDAHFDFVQVQQLNSPLTIEGNVFNGIGDGDTNGATNTVRAVPNDNTQGPKAHAIEVYENVMTGMGHQLENDSGSYIVAAYHTNWQDLWAYSPHQLVPPAAYFDNHVLSTGEPIPDVTL
jgi:hypothetical protein